MHTAGILPPPETCVPQLVNGRQQSWTLLTSNGSHHGLSYGVCAGGEPTIQELSAEYANLHAAISQLTNTVGDHSAALSCDSERRRMEDFEADALTNPESPLSTADLDVLPVLYEYLNEEVDVLSVLSDYLAQNPSLAAKMNVHELMDHIQQLAQRFGQQAPA